MAINAPEPKGLTFEQARHARSIARHLFDVLSPLAAQMSNLAATPTKELEGWNRDIAKARFTTEFQADLARANRVITDMIDGLDE